VLLAIVTEFSGGDQTVLDRATAVIDQGYPHLSKEDCGPSPVYPFPAKSGDGG
jgi:hypothetical protein